MCLLFGGSFPSVCLSLVCFVQLDVIFSFYLIIFYLVTIGCYLLEACYFFSDDRQKGNRSRWEWRGCGEELGGVEGEESIIRINHMRKESLFNKRTGFICKKKHITSAGLKKWHQENYPDQKL